jgi:hypothetical protein
MLQTASDPAQAGDLWAGAAGRPELCNAEPAFPQEPTLDQFFGESQFESYRQLGEFEAQSVCANGPAPTMDSSWIDHLIGSVRSHLDHEEMAWVDDWLKRL